MRVCVFVANPLTHDARIFREAEALANAGHAVTLIGLMQRGLPRTEERDGFTVVRVDRRLSLRARVRAGWFWGLRVLGNLRRWRFPLNQRADAANAAATASGPESPESGPPPRAPSGLRTWLAMRHYWRAAGKVARQLPPADVYQATDLNTLTVGARAAKRTGARLVYDSHELWNERPGISRIEKPIWRAMERRLIKRADRVITVSGPIAEELAKRYGIEEPAVILNTPEIRGRIPVEGASERLRGKAGLDGHEPIVIFQGRIGYGLRGGLAQLITAAKSIRGAVVVMMGLGAAIPELQAMVDDEGLSDRVRFTGAVPQEELLSYTAGATIGVVPVEDTNLSQYFTAPNKLFEYIAVGLPVVATRLPFLERIVEEHEVGLVCEPGDPESMAAAINRLLSDRELYDRCRANALEAAKVFNWEQESKKYLALYEGVYRG